MDKLVIGVDGGGTKTVAWLARVHPERESEILGRGTAGSSNLHAVGWDQALANLHQAIRSAWSDAIQDFRAVEVAAFALAGAGQANAQAQIQEWVRQQGIALNARVMHDARAVLLAGSPLGWGVALVAGTGAVAFAEDAEGKQAIAGGWGYWFGDEGSAFWLGQTALRAATQAVDGRGPVTRLTPAILERLEISDPREILPALSRAGDVRQGIAALADLVSSAAAQHDQVSRQIVDESVVHLVGLIHTAANMLSLGNGFPLVLAGGVICGSSLILERLKQELSNNGIDPSSLQVTREPVLGCLRWARREAVGNGLWG